MTMSTARGAGGAPPLRPAPSAEAAGAAVGPPAAGRRSFWYRIGHGHVAIVRAADEDSARRAVLARHPHARGQRLAIAAWED